MEENLIITIGRQSGSGGREIGRKLAEKLGVKCYDKELLALAAKNSGLCEELFKSYDEKPTHSLLYSLWTDTYSGGRNTDMPINHKIFLAQVNAMKKLADENSCVFVGRCADYALSGYPNVVRVFVTASDADRIARIKTRSSLDDAKAKELMVKTDKNRSSYYNYYSGKKWGDARNYDLCLSSSAAGIDGAVDAILAFARIKQETNQV